MSTAASGDRSDRETGKTPDAPEESHVESAGAFDIRTFIGSLIGLFGLLVLAMGIFDFTEFESAKTGGINANLWAGIVMVLFGIAFIVWARVKPIRILVQPNEPGADDEKDLSAVE